MLWYTLSGLTSIKETGFCNTDLVYLPCHLLLSPPLLDILWGGGSLERRVEVYLKKFPEDGDVSVNWNKPDVKLVIICTVHFVDFIICPQKCKIYVSSYLFIVALLHETDLWWMIWYIYLLWLGVHPVAVVCKLVEKKQSVQYEKQYTKQYTKHRIHKIENKKQNKNKHTSNNKNISLIIRK